MELFTAYQGSGSVSILTEAVAVFREAAAASDGRPHRHLYWHNLGYALQQLFERTGDTAVLAEMVQVCRKAVAAAPDTYRDRVEVLNNLVASLREAYEHTGDVALLVESVQLARDNASGADWHPDGAFLFGNLATSLDMLFERTGNAAVLADWVQVATRAVELTPEGDPRQGSHLNQLGSALAARYARTGKAAALDEAVRMSRKAVAASPNDRVYLANLGEHLRMLFERTGDTAVLAESVRVSRHALAAAPDNAAAQASLSSVLLTLASRTGQVEDRREALVLAREAVATARPDDKGRAGYLANLAGALEDLYERTGDTAPLVEAVQTARQAVAAAPVDHPLRALCLTALLNSLSTLFERTADTALLEESMRVATDAVAATPDDHPDRPGRLQNLATVLESQFERTGDTALLRRAVQVSREALVAVPAGESPRPGLLHTLGGSLQLLFERTGDTAALTEAVQVHREAVACTPAGHPKRVIWLNGLETALQSLFERTRESAVLAEAVQVAREAAGATPEGHVDRAWRLINLGSALNSLARRTRDDVMLAESLTVTRDGLAQLPPDHPSRAIGLNNLATGLREIFTSTRDIAQLTEAVQVARDAVTATGADHPDRVGRLHNLSQTLQRLYGETEQAPLLAEAVRVSRSAVAATPVDHPERAKYLNSLGIALATQSESTGDDRPMVEAWQSFVQAAHNPGVSAMGRIWSYRRAAEAGERAGRPAPEVLALVESAVELLAQFAPRAQVRADREHSLGRMVFLASQAAAAAVAAGRPERAVELLEQTRGVLVADRLDAFSADLTSLARLSPELAGEFGSLRARIDAIDNSPTGAADTKDPVADEQARTRQRQHVYAALDDLVSRIRGLQGFADFLEPPNVRRLAAHAVDGPVVFVYSHLSRCDALILTGEQDKPVRVVPLGPVGDALDTQVNRLHDALRDDDQRGAQDEILDVLAWVWDTIAEPVLTVLGHTAIPAGTPWPRVWWCPVGPFAYLPLHAAGHHRDVRPGSATAARAGSRAVMDRVVSSYVTTVRGLGYARAQHAETAAGDPLIIAVREAPGLPELKGADAEAIAVAGMFPNARVPPHPTRETVLAELPAHRIVHFACHGYADWDDPSASRLALYDHQTAPLTVADISALHLTGGLAFLSACETASTGLALTNEAVHITGAFHLAGYRHVVGTLWPIPDRIAAEIAREFYRRLTSEGTAAPDLSRASRALHEVIRTLRNSYPDTPSLWAAHTHTGT